MTLASNSASYIQQITIEAALRNASSDIVSEIAQEASLSGGNPFEDEARDPVRLIDELVVGTEE